MSYLQVVGSGSSGNGYLLTCDDETLVIECGKRFKDVKVALNFQIRNIVGAITTHVHADHNKYKHQFERSGITVWTPWQDSNLRQVKRMGGFKVSSFDCVHDVPCVGYLIEHTNGLKMLYASDTEYVKYVFRGLTAMLIEMNYSDEYIDRDAAKYAHSKQGHMEKQTTLDCIKANVNEEKLRNVVLCHLSRDGADPSEFKAAVKDIVPEGVRVDIAAAGLKTELR